MSDFNDQFENAEKAERPEPLPLRRSIAPAQPYPLKALGKVLMDATLAITDKVFCPDAIAAQSVLAAAALATQAHANVKHPATLEPRPLSLFLVTVAASGERKSAADRFAIEPIKTREGELHDKHEQEQRVYRDAQAVYDKARDVIIKGPKIDQSDAAMKLAALKPPPAAPLVPVLTAPDPTLEGLHKLFAIGEPSMGLFSDEGGTFIGGYGMSDESRLRTGSGLSDLWDGKPIKRVRGGDGVTVLKGRRLSLHIMVQPGIADGLLSDPTLQQQGLMSRLLVSEPPSLAGTRMQRTPKQTTEPSLKRYNDRLLKLLRQPQQRVGVNNPELRPRLIALSRDARNAWAAFADECERELAAGQKFEPIRGFANKLAEHALRISAVLEMVENPVATEISASTFCRAKTLARYYVGEALRIFEQGASSIEIQRAEKVLRWLHEKGKTVIGLKEIYQYGPPSIREARLAREAMRILEQHGWVTSIEGGAKIDRMHNREAWEVAPP
jgi:hypothetical protein